MAVRYRDAVTSVETYKSASYWSDRAAYIQAIS